MRWGLDSLFVGSEPIIITIIQVLNFKKKSEMLLIGIKIFVFISANIINPHFELEPLIQCFRTVTGDLIQLNGIPLEGENKDLFRSGFPVPNWRHFAFQHLSRLFK